MTSQDISETEAFLQGLSDATGVAVDARSERLLAVAEELGLARPEADFDIATGRPLAPEL